MQPKTQVPDDAHRRPSGVADAIVEAVGMATEALEWIERARGRLYDFHQMMGHADTLFGSAADALATAGEAETADLLGCEIVGRNVLDGRWTFQVVEEFDDGYYRAARAIERDLRIRLLDGKRHVFEAEMKERRRTSGHPGHTSRPEG